jgi:predicted TPR repeat methyltransferase
VSEAGPPQGAKGPAPGNTAPAEAGAGAAFERARDHFIAGIQSFEAGRLEQAHAQFEAALELLPGRVSTLVNLAAARIRLGRPADALAPLDQALAAAPADAEAWSHRGVALGRLGRHEEALASFDRALALHAADSVGWLRRGETLQQLDRPEEALASFDQALRIEPGLAPAWSLRGGALKDLQRPHEAAQAFEQAVAHGADAELHRFFLASLAVQQAPAAAPRQYVQHLFDNYADEFDRHLVDVLHYQAHQVLVRTLADLGLGPFASALDLGCGTGLCAPLLQPLVATLDGVDLSAKMLARARSLGRYDQLLQADITEHLQTTTRRYELVLATDVFIYIGELAPVFRGVQRILRHGGVFCFSVEPAGDELDFALLQSRRYAHSERHLRELARQHGFETLRMERHAIRQEQGTPIQGLFAYLARTG